MSGTGRMRTAGLLALAGLVLALFAGCGIYYYRAPIQGFVIDGETEAGINEATVRIYTQEVSSADVQGYVAQTSTVTQGGSAGYYSSTVIWGRWFGGAYGEEGDTTTIWLGVTHPDYGSVVVPAEGILSDEDNLVASIRLSQTTFELDALRGRVVDANGAGVNGVRVVLDLPQVDDSEDDSEDQVAQTATIDGAAGTYLFSPVEWSDANTEDPNGEVTAVVRVDDPEWGAETPETTDGIDDYTIERTLDLVPGEQTRVVQTPIEVYRRPRSEFTATVTGRLFERVIATDGTVENRPVQGIRVELSYDEVIDGSPPELAETLIDYTDADGAYLFTVTWTDTVPGEYDNAGNEDLTGDSAATAGIAAGEDGLLVDVSYSDLTVTPGSLELAFSTADLTDHEIYSNPRGGTNRLPDVAREATAP